MTTQARTHQDASVQVAGLRLAYMHAGEGRPLVVLHHSTGNYDWFPFHAELARDRHVIVPDMPGYGQSERPEWAREPRDLAELLHRALDHMGLETVSLLGLGFGGWVAAEMAVMRPQRFDRLVLVGAAGIRPNDGFITDQMTIDHEEYVRAGFADESAFERTFGVDVEPRARELWDYSREMTARVSWKPYMWSWRLPSVLPEVDTPTLIVHGSEDAIVPRDVASQYRAALPHSRLEVVQGGGHALELEREAELAALVRTFLDS